MRSSILLKKKMIWTTKYAQTCNWFFFLCVKKIESSGVPIWLLTLKKLFSHIVQNITKRLYATFERFLMTASSARSILAYFSLKKNLTSNGCKPIRVLTCTKSLGSDDHLPIGYLLPDFQPHRSNFLAVTSAAAAAASAAASAAALTRKKGGRHVGGAPPPQTPPGGIVPIEL
jgi:hypothetical protein